MNIKFYLILFTILFNLSAETQVSKGLLQNFADSGLFNLYDKDCPNLSGEWFGEETEYYDQQKNEKGKYSISFVLTQQGNKVTGISQISFENGTSYGKLKIRGLVAGNKFYFEEYEVVEQKFTNPAVLWCLRSGELDIELIGNRIVLQGSNYKGYASYYYFDCQGFVSMNVSKTLSREEKQVAQKKLAIKEDNGFQMHPNPANTEVTITFKLAEDSQVNIGLYSLSGELIGSIVNGFFAAGTHQNLFTLNTYPAGAYIVRMLTGNQHLAKTLIIAR